jgi:O-antigen ligase
MVEALLIVSGCAGFLFLVARPEVPFALLYNGSAIYFYIMYVFHRQPNTLITGGWYTVLLGSCLLGFLINRLQPRAVGFDPFVPLLFCYILFNALLLTDLNGYVWTRLSFAPFALGPYLAGCLLQRGKQFRAFISVVIGTTAALAVPFAIKMGSATETRFSLFSFGVQKRDNPILVGLTFSILVLILYVRLSDGAIRRRLPAWIALAAGLLITVRAGSRGAIVSLLISVVLYHVMAGLTPKRIVLLAILAVGAAVTWVEMPENLKNFYKNTTEPSEVNSVTRRTVLYGIAWQSYLSHPIFGAGEGVFMDQYDDDAYPHNMFLETAAELGTVGLILLTIVLLRVLVRARHAWRCVSGRNDADFRLAAVLLAQAFVEAQFSGFLTAQMPFFLMLGILSGMAGRCAELQARGRLRKPASDRSARLWPVPVFARQHESPGAP